MDLTDKKVLLLDIEGTTTSINFVKDVLFDYARKDLSSYLTKHYDDEEVREPINQLRSQIEEDVEKGLEDIIALPPGDSSPEDIISSFVRNVFIMMDSDRKLGPLKTLQGLQWKEAYEKGLVKGHVYEDVVPALEKFKEEGKDIYIYSSGSVLAQKLLFSHSVKGDILHYFSGHFDTGVGMKTKKESYQTISEVLKLEPKSILFITDVVKEATAAKEAGLSVALCVRPGNKPLESNDKKEFPIIYSFLDFYKNSITKKNKKRSIENVSTENISKENFSTEKISNENVSTETVSKENFSKENVSTEIYESQQAKVRKIV